MVVKIIIAVFILFALFGVLGFVFWDIKDETREFLVKLKNKLPNKHNKNKL